MSYLSLIRINPRRPHAIRLLGNPHLLHGAVLAGFPDPVAERVLWRLDADDPRRPRLLVLTQHTRPDWTHLVEQAGWPTADGDHFMVREYAPLLDSLAVGQQYAFRLHASTVQNTSRPEKPTPAQEARRGAAAKSGTRLRGFRLGHRTAAAQLAWLLKKAERTGFTIPSVRSNAPTGPAPGLDLPDDSTQAPDVALIHRDIRRFRKKNDGPQVTLTTATFEGRLRVVDPTALRAALVAGIGPAKAYGCGLLTLAPLPKEADHG
ncbi:type I-E CRISPR-associated protein Cas6/Cse3/CasE [Streptomyces sp. 4N509B]|uniref:type I-E CRISPR-associated protein Cas6/Cse3/CasE n=1 Tax=Streptomyces sp. 4N509B TaxID=3457413 RepID=UPI003FD39575